MPVSFSILSNGQKLFSQKKYWSFRFLKIRKGVLEVSYNFWLSFSHIYKTYSLWPSA